VQQVARVCTSVVGNHEIIVVLDGPGTPPEQVIPPGQLPGHHVRVLVNDRNRGKGFSVRRGMLEARGDYVLFTDADLSIPIESVGPFVAALDAGADVAIASRLTADAQEHGPRELGRHTMSRAFSTLVRLTMLRDVTDSQCGFKAFRRDVARRLFSVQRIDRFAFDVEILWLAQRWGYRVVEVPVACVYHSQSSVRRIFDSVSMVRDLARIRLAAILGRYDSAPGPVSAGAGRERGR
jgi:glycosyltransferase involved in cell wall biosynthesis